MGHPAAKRRATYADLEAVPRNMVGEILGGELHVFPRPAPPHAWAASALGGELLGPFSFGRGGPGGWWIVDEPELRLGPPPPGEDEAVIPDLAGWRKERMPHLPKTAHFTLAPDWICEVLSRSTEAYDRAEKMPYYARAGVRHLWLVHPITRTLEVFALGPEGLWTLLAVHRGATRVSAPPFAEYTFELASLWEAQGEEAEADAPTSAKAPLAATKSAAAAQGKKGRVAKRRPPTKGRGGA